MGLIPDAPYVACQLDLSNVRRLLLFTDGVLEAENKDGEQFMDTRLMGIAATDADKNLDIWLDNLISTVLDFSDGHHFDDDVCLLGVEISASTKALQAHRP